MVLAFNNRVMLRDDAQPLWDSLFEHLVQLVTCKVMTPNEVAAVFVPCMVSDKSPYQDKVLITKIQFQCCTDLKTLKFVLLHVYFKMFLDFSPFISKQSILPLHYICLKKEAYKYEIYYR